MIRCELSFQKNRSCSRWHIDNILRPFDHSS